MIDNVDLFKLIDERFDSDEDLSYEQLGKIIHQLKGWVCNGLGMKHIMLELLFDKIGRYYTDDDLLKEKEILNIIESGLTRIPNWKYKEQINYVISRKIIEKDGEWSPMSKYDTNYSVQSLVLGDLILMAKNDENCPFDVDFNEIYNEIKKLTPYYWNKPKKELEYTIRILKKNLNKIKDNENTLKDIINYYFPNPECFEKYQWKVLQTTDKGDKAEGVFIKVCPKMGFEIISRGFNGSIVDIVFGVDFIVKKLKTGKLFTVQVKNKKPKDKEIEDYFDKRFIDVIVWKEDNNMVLMNKERITKTVKI